MKAVLYISFLTVVLFGCKRTEFDPYFGEQSCPSEDFEIVDDLTIDIVGTDFNNGDSVVFSAVFNEQAPLEIEIKGLESNATRIVQLTSDTIAWTWYGESDGYPMFVDEEVAVTFSIRCREEFTLSQSIDIIGSDYISHPLVHFIEGFDGNGIGDDWGAYPAGDALYTMNVCNDTCGSVSPHGGNYRRYYGERPVLDGEEKNVYLYSEVWQGEVEKFSNDENVYLNFYANTRGTPLKLVVNFNLKSGEVGKKSLALNSTEWESVSIALNDLSVEPGFVASIDDPNLLQYMVFTIVQQEAVSPTILDVDFVYLSSGFSLADAE